MIKIVVTENKIVIPAIPCLPSSRIPGWTKMDTKRKKLAH
jgi:hypothetical protein